MTKHNIDDTQYLLSREQLKHKINVYSKYFRFVGSGKAAISLIFRYLASYKNYNPLIHEVFVPKFMGKWAYSQINQVAFSSPRICEDTRVIYIYHQYGIPQNVDELVRIARENNIFVVEDCAHTLGGSYGNSVIGMIGDYTIYSISKFLSIGPLGAIQSSDDMFLQYVEQQVDLSPRRADLFLRNLAWILRCFRIEESHSSPSWAVAYSLHNFSFRPWIKSIKKIDQRIEREINIRIKRLKIVRQELNYSGVLEYDIDEDYVAFALPIICDMKIRDRLNKKKGTNNCLFKEISFDVNRNMLNPNYKPGLLIDIGSRNNNFSRQIEILRKCL